MNRAAVINLRVTPEEKAALVRRAEEAELTLSEFVRLSIRPAAPPPKRPAAPGTDEAFEQRVRQLRKTMPSQNARALARREIAREKS